MSWLSSLFHGTKTTQPDTTLQQQQAQQQEAELEKYYQQLLDQQKAISDQQRADEERRYQEQQTASATEAERQRALQQAQIDAQTKASQDEAARQQAAEQQAQAQREADQQAAAAQAAQKAADQRTYADGRLQLLDKAKSDVDTAYAGFDDSYFNKFAQSFVDTYRPQVKQGFRTSVNDTTNAYGDAGNLRSSAAAKSFGDLSQQLVTNEGKVTNAASDAAQTFQNQVQGQKADALNLVMSSGAVGDENLPDGSDPTSALAGLGSQLGGLTSSATARAQAITAPSFNTNLDLSFATKKPTSYGIIA